LLTASQAGASAVDYHNYAFYKDPIAHAIFAQSGNAIGMPSRIIDVDNTNFTYIAQQLNCDFPNDAAAELACMKKAPYEDIINAMGHYQDNPNNTLPLSFSPFPDEKIVFYNNTKRYAEGRVSKVPMIYSSAANEGGSLSPFPADDPMRGPNQTLADMTTLRILCGAANSSILRNSIGLPTYRYQYAGNWTNQDPLPWMGAVRLFNPLLLTRPT
jgi:carboxylesterase type B